MIIICLHIQLIPIVQQAFKKAFRIGGKPRSYSLNESSLGHAPLSISASVPSSVSPELHARLPPKSPKEKLEGYCKEQGKPKPYFNVEKVDGKYKATVYVAKTCGRVTGELMKSKWDAEMNAAQQLLQKLGL